MTPPTIPPPKPRTLRFVFSTGPIQRQIHRNLKGSWRKARRLSPNQPPNPVGQTRLNKRRLNKPHLNKRRLNV
jgi:hypothetical protein